MRIPKITPTEGFGFASKKIAQPRHACMTSKLFLKSKPIQTQKFLKHTAVKIKHNWSYFRFSFVGIEDAISKSDGSHSDPAAIG